MSLLDNARGSIIVGLEDYGSSDTSRLTSCTRNLCAGILLLFKEKLSRLSPADSQEVLIKYRVKPTLDSMGALVWVGDGKKTLDVQQIQDRFLSLGISVQWGRVEKINKFRNDIEHYYSNSSKDSVQSLLANSFIVIRDFITEHLDLDPKEFLGHEAWNVLLTVAEVHEKEKAECYRMIASVEWGSDSLTDALSNHACDGCGSDLITLQEVESQREDNIFLCRSCGKTWDFETIAQESMRSFFYFANHVSYRDGGSLITIDCPECGLDTYVIAEKVCVVCGASVEHVCQRCCSEIEPEEIDGSGYCSWCSHMASKDD